MKYDHLTGTEVDKAHDAADYLIEQGELLELEPIITAKLSSLRADLTAEQEERRQIASA